MKILVTDGENRSALAVVRSLGRKGHAIFVAGRSAACLAASSRFCRKAFAVPDALENTERAAVALAEIVCGEGIEVVLPVTEQTICAINKRRRYFAPPVILACPTGDRMEAVSDKYRLFRLAERLGIPMPRTAYVPGSCVPAVPHHGLERYPVVIKPALSKVVEGERILSCGVMYARTADELARLYLTRPALRHPSLIQELVEGPGTGLFTLFDRDRHLALFSHRRLLEKPPSGGVSVLSESVPPEPEMVDAARRLLAEAGWCGIAMVEFKRDNRDGRAKLMEINGRFWGSLQLAVSSGIDFPALCLDYYLGARPDALLSDYRLGHRLKWPFGLLDHLLIRLKGRGGLLPPETPGLAAVLGELLSRGADTSLDVYDAEDTTPFVAEARDYIKQLLGLSQC